jgi:DNA-binding NarL/FixJ family response regulator
MKQIRVLLIEDHFLARMALHSVLSGHSQIRIIGEASDGEAGIAMYRQHRPDVVVLDLRLPRVSGFEVIVELRKEFPGARIVVLSNYRGSEDIYRGVRSGAMAYLTKDASGEELLNAIQNVDRGLRYLLMLPMIVSLNACRRWTAYSKRIRRCWPASRSGAATERLRKSCASPKKRSEFT